MSDKPDFLDSVRPEASELAADLFENAVSGGSTTDVAIGTLKDTAEGTLIKAFVGWVSRFTPAGRAAKSYAEAQQHLAHYRYAEALVCLTDALTHDPESVYLLRKRADVYKRLNHYDQALQDCNKAMILVPNHVDTHICRAKIYQQQGKTAEAIADFQQALHYSQPEYRLRIQAELYTLQGQPEQAFEAWSAVIADPALAWNRIYAYWQRAYTAQALERYDQALADYSVVLDLQANNIWALNQRAAVYAERQDYLNAIADISRSIELRSDSWNLYKRGKWYAAQSKWAEAIADYTAALEHDSQLRSIFWKRAVALTHLGDRAAAIQDYESYIAHEPTPYWRTRAEQEITKLKG
jgi:tetratricopeptide (TPR) repeat protein